jgi:hypothetical protein
MGIDPSGCCPPGSDGFTAGCQKGLVSLGPVVIGPGAGFEFIIPFAAPFAAPPWIVGLLDFGAAGPYCGVTWEIRERTGADFRLVVANTGDIGVEVDFFHYMACPAPQLSSPSGDSQFVCAPPV